MELGSGIGQFSLYTSLKYDCFCRGIERIPSFVLSSKRCANFLSLPCDFVEGDLWEEEWSHVDCIYLTATTFPMDWVDRIVKKSEEMTTGSYLIVLTHMLQSETLNLHHSFIGEFSWGVATVFIYRKE